ncbi:hypothetical protein EK904_001748 [Melospiza melodia maxima]|nr:hypothetical protein EK904_001748 [Melospiza melodia maxima]
MKRRNLYPQSTNKLQNLSTEELPLNNSRAACQGIPATLTVPMSTKPNSRATKCYKNPNGNTHTPKSHTGNSFWQPGDTASTL